MIRERIKGFFCEKRFVICETVKDVHSKLEMRWTRSRFYAAWRILTGKPHMKEIQFVFNFGDSVTPEQASRFMEKLGKSFREKFGDDAEIVIED